MTNSRKQHGIGSLAPDEKIVGKPGGIVEPGVKQYGIFKKIKKGVKKIFKSPLGKAALIGGLGWGVNAGMLPGAAGKGWFGRGLAAARGTGIGKAVLGTPFQKGPQSGVTGGLWNLMKKYPGRSALLGLGAAGIAAPFFGGDEEDQDEIQDWTIPSASIAG